MRTRVQKMLEQRLEEVERVVEEQRKTIMGLRISITRLKQRVRIAGGGRSQRPNRIAYRGF